MRIMDTFTVQRSPDEVFAFLTDPERLSRWQTLKTSVVALSEGPMGVGSRFREGNKVGPREWEQVVEVTRYEPPRAFSVRIIEGPRSSGGWILEPDGTGTRVHFEVETESPRLLGPLLRPFVRRQFRGYHDNLRRQLEDLPRAA